VNRKQRQETKKRNIEQEEREHMEGEKKGKRKKLKWPDEEERSIRIYLLVSGPGAFCIYVSGLSLPPGARTNFQYAIQ